MAPPPPSTDDNNKPAQPCIRHHHQNSNAQDDKTTASNDSNDDYNIPVEFAINFNHESDLAVISEAFKSQGLALTNVDVHNKAVQVDIGVRHKQTGIVRPSDIRTLQEFIERQTGFVTVIKGLGQVGSAVAELKPPSPPPAAAATASPDGLDGRQENILGVIRLSQMTNGSCFVDGSVSHGSSRGGGSSDEQQTTITANNEHVNVGEIKQNGHAECLLAIHEFGDLSGRDYENIGRPWVILADKLTLGKDQTANRNNSEPARCDNSIPIKAIVPNCDISSAIGKSIALSRFRSQEFNDSNECEREILSAGVVARASTIGSNKKQVCSCSGKTLWEERIDRRQQDDRESR